MKKLFFLSFFLVLSLFLQAQELVSNRQSYMNMNTNEKKETSETLSISLSGKQYRVELPGDKVISGGMTLEGTSSREGKSFKKYNLDNGGQLVVGPEFVNVILMGTYHNIAGTFYLDVKSEEEKRHELYIRLYDEFTANCIKFGKVKPGMAGGAVDIILGKPLRTQTTETTLGKREMLVYDGMYIHIDNGKVTSINTISK